MIEAALVVVGLFAGILGASLGVGGGIVFVPALVLIAGFGQHMAEGTSLAVILPTALIGTWVHHRHGRVVWPTALTVGAAGVVGAVVGTQVALSLDGAVLRRLYIALLVMAIVQLTLRSVRMQRAQSAGAVDGDVDDAGGEEPPPRL